MKLPTHLERGNDPDSRLLRMRLQIGGAVQGVGFRPYVYRLAMELGLAGWVNNSAQGVCVEVEGRRNLVEQFLLRIEPEKPPLSFIQSLEPSYLDPVGYDGFSIRESDTGGEKSALVLPDVATCPDCLRDIFDPENRRYLYPFTNCTNCGPRYSIIEALPYDRPNTSMKSFEMCERCRAEYENPGDRRFHAQPNACPCCGPHVELWDGLGERLCARRRAVVDAAQALMKGSIVAVKGLGGFHLMTPAQDERAVRRLRELKHREEKPLAVMFPSIEEVKVVCEVSPLEERLLRSAESPIVLLRSKPGHSLAASVAPNNPYLGVMLPYTPLHHLLLAEIDAPVVATSGNISDEPICIDEQEALTRLSGIADLFLVHNRRIVRHVDDSIVRVMAGREMVLRRARGYAPLPVKKRWKEEGEGRKGRGERRGRVVLAVGAHLKNAVALSVGDWTYVSQHIGDLETAAASNAFARVIQDLERLYEARPDSIAADGHPDYLSTKFALRSGVPVVRVQHHYAHVLSCMADNGIEGPVLGVSWDGTGDGLDGTIWGGEFLRVTEHSFERVAHLRQFRLPGGEQAVREPRRPAIGLLYEIFGEEMFAMADMPCVASFSQANLTVLKTMLAKGLNAPVTSSVGRLFDAVSSISGLRQVMKFEGQSAMELEFLLDEGGSNGSYGTPTIGRAKDADSAKAQPLVIDWEPMIREMIADVTQGLSVPVISAKFHAWLVEMIVVVAREIGEERVLLTGGCFQNKYLCEHAVRRLSEEGFRPYWHQRVPPNDGGIALGQVMAALRAGAS